MPLPLVYIGYITLTTLGAALSGCKEDLNSCEGFDSKVCDGKAAQSTQIEFEEAYVNTKEQAKITSFLKNWEAPLRQKYPKIFCHFDGWKITSKALSSKYVAYYQSSDRSIYLQKSLVAYWHEFCHHIDYEYCADHSQPFSASQIWQKLSCSVNQENMSSLDGCVAPLSMIKQAAHEEFAQACVKIISNPPGALLNNSGDKLSREQTLAVSKAIGHNSSELNGLLETVIRPPQKVEVKIDFHPNELLKKWVGNYYVDFGNGKIGAVTPRFIYVLSQEGRSSFRKLLVKIPLPTEFNIQTPHSFSYLNNTLYLASGGDLFANANVKLSSERPLPLFGQLARVGGSEESLFHFDAEAYRWIEFDSLKSFYRYEEKTYPSNIIREIEEAVFSKILMFEGEKKETYLWLAEIRGEHHDKVSKLYRLNHQEGELSFEKEFEIPSLPFHSYMFPINYEGHWYISGIVENFQNYDDFWLKSLKMSHSRGNFRVLLKIEEGGSKITPQLIHSDEFMKNMILFNMNAQLMVFDRQILGFSFHDYRLLEQDKFEFQDNYQIPIPFTLSQP